MKLLNKLGLGAGLSAAGMGVANAAYDTAAVATAMGDALTAIAAVGVLYLGVKVGIKVWPWIASAMGR